MAQFSKHYHFTLCPLWYSAVTSRFLDDLFRQLVAALRRRRKNPSPFGIIVCVPRGTRGCWTGSFALPALRCRSGHERWPGRANTCSVRLRRRTPLNCCRVPRPLPPVVRPQRPSLAKSWSARQKTTTAGLMIACVCRDSRRSSLYTEQRRVWPAGSSRRVARLCHSAAHAPFRRASVTRRVASLFRSLFRRRLVTHERTSQTRAGGFSGGGGVWLSADVTLTGCDSVGDRASASPVCAIIAGIVHFTKL